MKIFVALFSLFIFVAELTLDSSTLFVRSSPAHDSAESKQTGNNTSQAKKLGLESSSHSALPASGSLLSDWNISGRSTYFSEIKIPHLNPPFARIERPPIC